MSTLVLFFTVLASATTRRPCAAHDAETHDKALALLKAEKWGEAAELYGQSYQFESFLNSAHNWNRHENDAPPEARRRFARGLAHTLFYRRNFADANTFSDSVFAIAEEYLEGIDEAPLEEVRLNLSHLDLLPRNVWDSLGRAIKPGPGHLKLVQAALESDPESIPANLAMMYIWSREHLRKPSGLALAEKSMRGEYGKLCLARMAAATSSAPHDNSLQFRLLEKHWKLVPGDNAKVWLHLRWASLDEQNREKLYLQCIENYPEGELTGHAREGYLSALLKRDDVNAAESFIARESALGRDGVASCLFTLSDYYLKRDDAKSEVILLKLLKDYPTTASAAMLKLSEVYQLRGDEEATVIALKECIDAEKFAPGTTRIVLPYSPRGKAELRLAVILERRGEWNAALPLWVNWYPNSGCGTCLDHMEQQRAFRIVRCHSHLGKHAIAASLAWSHCSKRSTPELAWSLYSLYRDAGQLDELRRVVRAHQSAQKDKWNASGAYSKSSAEQIAKSQPTYALSKLLETGVKPAGRFFDDTSFDWDPPQLGSLPKLEIGSCRH